MAEGYRRGEPRVICCRVRCAATSRTVQPARRADVYHFPASALRAGQWCGGAGGGSRPRVRQGSWVCLLSSSCSAGTRRWGERCSIGSARRSSLGQGRTRRRGARPRGDHVEDRAEEGRSVDVEERYRRRARRGGSLVLQGGAHSSSAAIAQHPPVRRRASCGQRGERGGTVFPGRGSRQMVEDPLTELARTSRAGRQDHGADRLPSPPRRPDHRGKVLLEHHDSFEGCRLMT